MLSRRPSKDATVSVFVVPKSGALPSTSLRVRRAQQLPNNSGMVSQATSIQEGDRPKRLLPDGRAQPPNSRVRKS